MRGNNDLLNLSRPDAVRAIHLAYFRAGADIVSTNTFSSTRIAQADYGMAEIAYELNAEGARLAREAARIAQDEDGRERFVAGAIGPTNRTASISPDVSNPGFRAITFDELRARLCRAGSRAARRRRRSAADRDHFRHAQRQGRDLCHRRRAGRARHRRAGDDLGHDHRPLRPSSVRPDAGSVLEFDRARGAAFGRAQLRARRQGRCARISPNSGRVADTLICAYPNAGLPNEFGHYDEGPDAMAALIGEFAASGLVNIVGGCCGTTPDHIRAIAARGGRQGAARRFPRSRRGCGSPGSKPSR